MRQNCFKFHKNFFKNYLQINFFVLILHLQHCWGENKDRKGLQKNYEICFAKKFFLVYLFFVYLLF